jgi:hypothetical protein
LWRAKFFILLALFAFELTVVSRIICEYHEPRNFSQMTDHELQLKAVVPRRSEVGPAFQPEGLAELSPGLRGALPWVSAPQNLLHPEGVREPVAPSTALAPLHGAGHLWALTQGSLRCAPATLGWIPVTLQATNRPVPHYKSHKRKFSRIPFRVFGVFRGENLFSC